MHIRLVGGGGRLVIGWYMTNPITVHPQLNQQRSTTRTLKDTNQQQEQQPKSTFQQSLPMNLVSPSRHAMGGRIRPHERDTDDTIEILGGSTLQSYRLCHAAGAMI
jgi:hypothetical protein